jgi:phosphate transport system substrate-binding protein
MFIYVNDFSLQRPVVKDFIEYYLNNAGALAEEVGFVGLSDEEYQSQFALLP